MVTGACFPKSLALGSLVLRVQTENSGKMVGLLLQGNCYGASVTEGVIYVPPQL